MTKIFNRKMVMALFAFSGLAVFAGAAENDICIQFGNKAKSENWNSITMKDKSVSDMVNAKGEKSGITIKVTSKFSGVNKSGIKKAAEALAIPADVSADSLFGMNKNQKVHVEISGLNKDKKYQLTFYASRMGAKDNRETVYDVEGASTEKATLDVANNTDKTAEIAVIQPTQEGKVVITISKGKNNNNKDGYFYLGAMKISEVK